MLLDDCIPIPGTERRIGFDPILGLIPGVGDGSATAIGSIILVQAVKAGVSKVILMRMSVNLLINGMIGSIPILGDLFSAWFKSNLRNFYLLKKHQNGKAKASWTDWCVVSIALVVIVSIAVILSLIVARVVIELFSWIFGAV